MDSVTSPVTLSTIPELVSILQVSDFSTAVNILTAREAGVNSQVRRLENELVELKSQFSELREENLKLRADAAIRDVIEISDCEEEKDGLSHGDRVDDEEEKDGLRRGDQIGEAELKDFDLVDRRDEKELFSSATPKRKTASRVITSDSENEDYGERIKQRRIEELNDLDDKILFDVDEEENSKNLRPWKRLKKAVEEVGKFSDGVSFVKNRTPGIADRVKKLRSRAGVSRKLSYSDCQEEGEEDLGDRSSESGDVSLSAFIVNDSDVESILPSSDEENANESDSESARSSSYEEKVNDTDCESAPSSNTVAQPCFSDSDDDDVCLDKVLSRIRREKNSKVWEYEADMLSSFGKDPELCAKAVCALYRQQTQEEKSAKGTLVTNNRGFNKFDAERGSIIAEFLLDGDPHGEVKKSVEDLRKYDKDAVDYCQKVACRYSKQLFNIYQNGEDPFFVPS